MFKIQLTVLLTALLVVTGCTSNYESAMALKSDNFKDGVFVNSEPFEQPSIGKTFEIAKRFFFEERINGIPETTLPLEKINSLDLKTRLSKDTVIYRLGHSSLLLELAGQFWLTDPMFSDRASPVQWYGPKRFHPNPISIEDLPNITGVIISHDH